MKVLRTLIVACAMMTALSGCKSQYELLLSSNDVDAKYNGAFDYFNLGKYSKAAALFESLGVYTSGTERDDTVRYYCGLANYRSKDFYTADTKFEEFATTYPRSPFTEDARFLRLDCLYRQTLRYELDQSPTYTALTAMSEYIMDYPESEKIPQVRTMIDELGVRLDTKAFEAARLYYHTEDYLAARVAFKNVIKDDADNVHREEILYYIAMSSYKYAANSVHSKQRERYLSFIDDYYNFVGELPESKYRRELDSIYKRAQKATGKDVVTDDLKDKEFEKERKLLEKAAKKLQKNETEPESASITE
ncbi:MAG: outer membrane protein assembly factor BamD [Bacteroidales bacterium]|nr:outer membrane protein assembly factor BamD [Bacteroidales bacterium]